jgi:hypothetical protein
VALQKLDRESKVPPIAADVMELLRAPPLRPVLRSTTSELEAVHDDRIGHLEDGMRHLHTRMAEMMDAMMSISGRAAAAPARIAATAPSMAAAADHSPFLQEPTLSFDRPSAHQFVTPIVAIFGMRKKSPKEVVAQHPLTGSLVVRRSVRPLQISMDNCTQVCRIMLRR